MELYSFLTFCLLYFGGLFFRNTFEGLSELEGGTVSAHYVRFPLPTVVPIFRLLWGESFCHQQQTLARNTWEVILLHLSGGRRPGGGPAKAQPPWEDSVLLFKYASEPLRLVLPYPAPLRSSQMSPESMQN